jgi:hypothetical protein
MVTELTQSLVGDGGYDFAHKGAVVGRLVWVSDLCDAHPRRGWWLTVPGVPDELIYQVPAELFGDLPAARARGVSMSLGLAQHMLADRVEGLLDGRPAP